MSTITLAALKRDIEDFIRFKRMLGRRYVSSARLLHDFEHFARQHAKALRDPHLALDALIEAWLSRAGVRKPTTTAIQFGTIRELCLYRRRRVAHSYVPNRSLAPRRGPAFLPYLLSQAQVRALLQAARAYPGQKFSGEMLYLLLLMLYCTGLRPGEPLRLRVADLDLRARTFLIRESKGRTRVVPFGGDLAAVLARYLNRRTEKARSSHSPQSFLLLDLNGQALSMRSITKVICKLWRRVGIKPLRGEGGPRPYDLRHAFAIHRLTRWYRQGVDLHARLPWLSAYMGHDNLLGTESYLHATPQLLRTASLRFARRFKQKTHRL